ncbi:MAG: PEP/pyruvate-binding domain-containing protein [Pseudomonadota bacterium]
MGWFRTFFGSRPPDPGVGSIRDKYAIFMSLLEKNNRVLEAMSDLEEKSQGEYLFDINYVKAGVAGLESGVSGMIEDIILLGGEKKYGILRDKFRRINASIESMVLGSRPIEKDDFIIPFGSIGRDRSLSVGGKSVQLGELKRLGLPVPDGFAISAWAYRRFMDANSLQERVGGLFDSLDIGSHDDLVRISDTLRGMIRSGQVPDDLACAITEACAGLAAGRPGATFAMRSSAIGEDSRLSFAGQYETVLNVTGSSILEAYRSVLASKFSPRAIYYYMSHGLSESDLAMGAACMIMVDAAASGVVYTRDPVRPDSGAMIINSIFGLGKYVVDGRLTPDVFLVSRDDGSILESRIAVKKVRLVMRPGEGVAEEPVPPAEQGRSSLTGEQVAALAGFASAVEQHYGAPQDIEWAIDRQGTVFLLQARGLRVLSAPRGEVPDLSGLEVLASGGTTVCPGAGHGRVFPVRTAADMHALQEGDVLVVPLPYPGLVTVMKRAAAIVTEVGGAASHMATIAREQRIPTLAGVGGAMKLAEGGVVTVDATAGNIYAGAYPGLVEARRPEFDLFEDTDIFELLKDILTRVTPLNLIQPSDPGFAPENCRTLHDITRFVHQKAMDEMFRRASGVSRKDRIGFRLKSDVPFAMNVICLDGRAPAGDDDRWISEDEIASLPMKAFWKGLSAEAAEHRERPVDMKGFMSLVASSAAMSGRIEHAESSYAILGGEYMILGLNMGYHFASIEAMCSDSPSKNFIRMQYKEGGASFDRRLRRVRLISEICSAMGFENQGRADFLFSRLAYQDRRAILDKLYLLGRLSVMTRQLDMSLSSDAVARGFTDDFLKKLGLTRELETEIDVDI